MHNTLDVRNTRIKLTTMAIQSKTRVLIPNRLNHCNVRKYSTVLSSRQKSCIFNVFYSNSARCTRNLYTHLSSSSFVYTSRICKWIFIFPDSPIRDDRRLLLGILSFRLVQISRQKQEQRVSHTLNKITVKHIRMNQKALFSYVLFYS